MCRYKVYSPWADVDDSQSIALRPRIDSLEGKKIGLFAHFKEHSPLLLQEVAKLLGERYPTATFSLYQYKKDTAEIVNDPELCPSFQAWVNSVDAVISAYGDMGSCALFLAYNTAYIEKLGKPTVILADPEFVNSTRRGAKARFVPAIRIVRTNMHDLSILPALDETVMNTIICPAAAGVVEDVIHALTDPLTEEEKTVHFSSSHDRATEIFEGTLEEINRYFYQRGWTNGAPVVPPTEEAVAEMCRGTDLPRDYVVAELPPMLGKATVEKIAINAVMAGCLPVHMPVLIAAVKTMVDPRIHLEGWTCSRGSWAPHIIISGPIRKQIGLLGGNAIMSPYSIAAATISKAFGYIVMNISGVRKGKEDLCGVGHEGRFGIVFGEDEENSPWAPLHTDFGFDSSDSAVTLCWPAEKRYFRSRETESILTELAQVKDFGFDPGCSILICPEQAQTMAKDGWTKQMIKDYIVEYARRPASEISLRWIRGNNHVPKTVQLPINKEHSTRCFWSDEHMLIVVGGAGLGAALVGGGDHGGPACTKIDLPAEWDALAAKYADYVPEYEDY